MEIKKLDRKDNIKTRALYEEVFSEDSKGFVDYYYTEKIKDNDIYVIEDKGEIVSMIHLNPYEMVLFEKKLPIHYIVAVATRKEYRGQGYMKELLIRVLNDLREAKEVITYLMPVAEAIYSPYDFCTVNEKKWIYYKDVVTLEKDEKLRPLKADECGELADMANEAMNRVYDLYIYRDATYYGRLIKEYESDNASLMVRTKADKIIDLLPAVNDPQMRESKFMIRILNIEEFLPLVCAKRDINAVITIKDDFIKDNNRWYHITAKAHEKIVVKPVINDVISDVEEISIKELTQRVFKELIPPDKIRFDQMV